MRRFALLLVVLGVLAVSAVPAGATHSWANYHWARSSNPFSLTLVDSLTSDWDVHLAPVASDWTASSVLDTPVVSSSDSSRTRKRCAAPRGQVRVCNATYGFNGWLGIAEIWLSGDHIAKARARVNDSYFSLSPYNDPNAKRHVLCQEVGHTLGLGHQSAVSCMDDVNGLFDPAYVSPNAHDYEQLETIYTSHKDGATASSFSSASGGTSVIVTRSANYTRITWIFWA